KQFVLAMYLSALIFSVASVALLYFLYYLSIKIVGSTANLFHLVGLVNSSNRLVYLWVDFTWILFFFSLGMIVISFWFNYGTVLSLSVATLFLIISMVIVVFGNKSWLIEVIFMNHLQFVTILFRLAIVFLLSSYLLMKKAPLEKGS